MPTIETADGIVVRDSTRIIDHFEEREPRFAPRSPCQSVVSLLFDAIGSEGLLRPAMHYRWNFPVANDAFLQRHFEMLAPEGVDSSQMAEANMQRMRNAGMAFGVVPKIFTEIESLYESLLELLDAHFAANGYLIGGKPSIGDFGLIAPLYAHLGRDPEPLRIMKARAPMVVRWVERMNACDADMPEFPEQRPEFLPGDEVPETLLEILRLMASDFLPEMLGIFGSVESWLVDHPDNSLSNPLPHKSAAQGPGPFGTHHFLLRGVPIELGVRHYAIWMAQRPLDFYAALDVADRERADRILDATGLRPLFNLSPSFRLERREHKEYLVHQTREGTPS
jgi:glutathione S-transferase